MTVLPTEDDLERGAGSARFSLASLFLGVAAASSGLRLLYAAQVELLPEETYYWNYSRHLDLSYLDHPPMVAWLVRLGTTLFGETEFGVRFGALLCGLTTAFFVFRLTRNVCGSRCALPAVVLSMALPFFFMSGLLMTPDAPLTAAWAATLYFSERALFGDRPSAWLWFGTALGIGLLSKYTIALLGTATLVFMLLDPPSRRWFRRWQPYAAVLIAVVVFAPVILWNLQHDWASFAFQTSRRLTEGARFSLHKLIGGAIVLITPTGVVAIAVALRGGHTAPDRRLRFLKTCVLVPLTVFFCFSLRHEVKLDWTGAPWLAALPLMAVGMIQAHGAGAAPVGRRLRAAWPPTLLALCVVYGFGWCYLVLDVTGLPYWAHTELLPVAWRTFGRQIEDLADAARQEGAGDVLVVGMDRYAIASEGAFYAGDRSRSVATRTSSHLFGDMGLMYEQWFPVDAQARRTLLLVAWDAPTLFDPRLAAQTDSLGAIHEVALTRNGRYVRSYFYRLARGYHPWPLKVH